MLLNLFPLFCKLYLSCSCSTSNIISWGISFARRSPVSQDIRGVFDLSQAAAACSFVAWILNVFQECVIKLNTKYNYFSSTLHCYQMPEGAASHNWQLSHQCVQLFSSVSADGKAQLSDLFWLHVCFLCVSLSVLPLEFKETARCKNTQKRLWCYIFKKYIIKLYKLPFILIDTSFFSVYFSNLVLSFIVFFLVSYFTSLSPFLKRKMTK